MKKIAGVLLVVAITLSCLSAAFSSDNAVAGEGVFADVPTGAPYFEAVNELSRISELGYPDRTFRPDRPITRAEFVTLLLKMFESPELANAKVDQIFVDVPVSNWANRYITVAFDSRLINGYGRGIFKPNETVSYEEMIKIVVSYILDGGNGGISYPDGYIKIAEGLGIADLQSAVGQDAKRWQAAVLIYNAINLDKSAVTDLKARFETERMTVYGMDAAPTGGLPTDVGTAEYESADMLVDFHAPLAEFDGETPGKLVEFPLLPDVQVQVRAGLLTAGEWNDNHNWDYWNVLMANREWFTLQSKWEISTNRYVVSVYDEEVPVVGAQVVVSEQGNNLWTAITDNRGDAVVFASALSDEQSSGFSLTVTTADDSITLDNVILPDDKPFEVEISGGTVGNSIDVMFMVDTTGSMGDELQYIKEELSDVVSRITADVRVSCNFYRDVGDEYIVRPFGFTFDVDEAVAQISKQRAAGGGDYPEAVEIALLNAIDEHEWNPNAKERFLFLVLDAPPHHDDERIATINECIKRAAEKGIRIIPIASSGVDKETEFLLRSMSIATNGTYVFLTDHSGIGNSHIEPTIGQYEIEYLNDLIVKIINDRL